MKTVVGGGAEPVALGEPPYLNTDNPADNDWIILVRKEQTTVAYEFEAFDFNDRQSEPTRD